MFVEDWKLVEKRPIIDTIPQRIADEMIVTEKFVNNNTLEGWEKIWTKNLVENNNRWNFQKYSAKKLKDTNKRGACFLIGAGPSLKYNIRFLKDKKGIIIASSHILKTLLANGIKPHYVIVLDAKDVQAEFLDVGDESKNLTLISDILVSPLIWDKWKGKVLFFQAETFDKIKEMIRKYTDFDCEITTGGHVIGAAYIIACSMKSKRIVFVGTDYCNDLSPAIKYSNNLYGEDDKNSGSDAMITCDIQGKGVYTLLRQYINKFWLDCISFQFPDIEHINATEGGILGAYLEGNLKTIKQMRLKEVN